MTQDDLEAYCIAQCKSLGLISKALVQITSAAEYALRAPNLTDDQYKARAMSLLTFDPVPTPGVM